MDRIDSIWIGKDPRWDNLYTINAIVFIYSGEKKSGCLRVLILVHTKNSVYFNNIRTYFFYFKYSFFKTSYIKLSIFTLHFIKISIFLDFFNCFFFFTLTHNKRHLLSFFILEICKEKNKQLINTKWIVSM